MTLPDTTSAETTAGGGVVAENLGKRFGDLWALRALDLVVDPGTVLDKATVKDSKTKQLASHFEKLGWGSTLIIDGVLMIREAKSPTLVREMLLAYLPEKHRHDLEPEAVPA